MPNPALTPTNYAPPPAAPPTFGPALESASSAEHPVRALYSPPWLNGQPQAVPSVVRLCAGCPVAENFHCFEVTGHAYKNATMGRDDTIIGTPLV